MIKLSLNSISKSLFLIKKFCWNKRPIDTDVTFIVRSECTEQEEKKKK